jgi:hypothetical protein
MNVTVVFWRLALVGAMTDGAIAAPIAKRAAAIETKAITEANLLLVRS